MPPRPLIASLATAVVLVLGLAGCTGSDEPTPSASVSPSTSASPSAAPGITDVTDTPGGGTDGAGGGFTGALADATYELTQTDGGWNVTGTVTNPTDAPADYRIYVSLLNGTGETRALTQVDVAGVAAGAASDWDTTIDLDEDGLNAILRVERYPA